MRDMFDDWKGAGPDEVTLLERAMAHAVSHARVTRDDDLMVDGYVLAPFIEFINHSLSPNSDYCEDGPNYELRTPNADRFIIRSMGDPKQGDQIT